MHTSILLWMLATAFDSDELCTCSYLFISVNAAFHSSQFTALIRSKCSNNSTPIQKRKKKCSNNRGEVLSFYAYKLLGWTERSWMTEHVYIKWTVWKEKINHVFNVGGCMHWCMVYFFVRKGSFCEREGNLISCPKYNQMDHYA